GLCVHWSPQKVSVGRSDHPRRPAMGSRLLAWVLWLQAWQVAAPCPGACVCYNEPKVTTSCPQQGLQAVPTGIPAASQRIFLHGNRITHVPAAGLPDAADKASVLEAGRPASAGNALKGRVPPGDTPPGNGSGPRHINDSPFGTLPSSAEPPLTGLRPEGSEPPGLPTIGPRRRPGCSRKNRTRSQCRLGQAGSGGGGAGDVEGSGALPALACSLTPLGLALVLWAVLGPC
ncbi:Reticulon-4 receptor, partial [Tupaia chinensis]